MAHALAQPTFSLDDYLAWEPTQTEKHDYVQGEVFAMTGGTLRHNRAAMKSAGAFETHLDGSRCKVFLGDVKVAVDETAHWFYPDVVVTCSERDLADLDAVAVREPVLLLEVLSPSTAAYDRGDKFLSLQKLTSLQEYALLDAVAPPTGGVPAQRCRTFRALCVRGCRHSGRTRQHWLDRSHLPLAGLTVRAATYGSTQ